MTKRILFVDDVRFDRRVYGDYLRAAGFEVKTAASGEEAIACIERERFDAVVADLVLPGMDGLGVLGAVRRVDPEVGVLLMTAVEEVEVAVRAIKMGAFDYLVKPVEAEHLQRAVMRCIEYRELLHENGELRRTVALTEAAARLAATNDASELCRVLTESLIRERPGAVALVAQEQPDHSLTLCQVSGGPPPSDQLLERLHALARADDVEPFVPLSVEACEPAGLGEGLVARIVRPSGVGLIALFSPAGGRIEELDRESLQFLGSQFAQARAAIDRVAEVESLVFRDDLTKLYNLRYLRQALSRQVQATEATGRGFSLLFIDVDNLKTVNDTNGHLVGSQLLVEVAQIIQACVREDDIAVRYGGDEYVVVLRDAGVEAARHVGERIRATVDAHHFLARQGKNLHVTASVGVATFPDHARDQEALIELADQAMYRGKAAGRNVVQLAVVERRAGEGAAVPESA